MSNCLSRSNEVCSHGSPPGVAQHSMRQCMGRRAAVHTRAPPNSGRYLQPTSGHQQSFFLQTAESPPCISLTLFPALSWRGEPHGTSLQRIPQRVPVPAGQCWAPCTAEQPAGHCGPGSTALQEKRLHQCRMCPWCFTRSCHSALADLVFCETAVAKAEPHCYRARQRAAVQGCPCNTD